MLNRTPYDVLPCTFQSSDIIHQPNRFLVLTYSMHADTVASRQWCTYCIINEVNIYQVRQKLRGFICNNLQFDEKSSILSTGLTVLEQWRIVWIERYL